MRKRFVKFARRSFDEGSTLPPTNVFGKWFKRKITRVKFIGKINNIIE